MFKSEKFLNLVKDFENNKNSHSYIFYTNDFFSCQKDVFEFVKLILKTNNLEQNTDFISIKKSDKKNIIKEEIQDLKQVMIKSSYLNNYRFYLIEEAHKLNSTSANMILKFLEEPMNKVIGLFITDNLDSVLGTIRSRCQTINIFYKSDIQEINDKTVEKFYDLLFNSNKYISLFDIKKNYSNIDRNDLIVLFTDLLNYLYNNIDYNCLYRIKLINHAITMLTNNVNIDYVFDYILLEGSE